MRIFPLLLCPFLLVATGDFFAQGLGQAFVRQTNLANGFTTDLQLQASSQSFDFQVNRDGSVFELWATDAWNKSLTLVDSKAVNVYSPEVTLEIQSNDPYSRGDPGTLSRVRRTRADQPFNVELQVTGFVSAGSGLNDLLFVDNRTRFDLITYTAAVGQVPIQQEKRLTNGPDSLLGEFHNLSLQGEDPRFASGERAFTVYWKDPKFDPVGGGINLAKEAIEIWPMTKLKFDGLVANEVYVDRIPTVTFEFQHLYPDSRTYVQIYQGTQQLGKAGIVVTGTERSYGLHYLPGVVAATVPQNYTVAIDDLSNYTPKDGIYTVEVITETPFARGGERLMHVTFEVDRIISTRGQLSTREVSAPAPAP